MPPERLARCFLPHEMKVGAFLLAIRTDVQSIRLLQALLPSVLICNTVVKRKDRILLGVPHPHVEEHCRQKLLASEGAPQKPDSTSRVAMPSVHVQRMGTQTGERVAVVLGVNLLRRTLAPCRGSCGFVVEKRLLLLHHETKNAQKKKRCNQEGHRGSSKSQIFARPRVFGVAQQYDWRSQMIGWTQLRHQRHPQTLSRNSQLDRQLDRPMLLRFGDEFKMA